MLVELKIQNYFSFKELNTFSMVGVKAFKENEKTNVIGEFHDLKLLKSAAIFGDNGSGKSNLLRAISYLKRLVISSFKNALDDPNTNTLNSEKFRLSTASAKQPTHIEIVFILGATLFRYGFELDGPVVVKEWLFQTIERETALFSREGDVITLNKTGFKEGADLVTKTKSNVLFLTRVAHDGGAIAGAIVGWFHRIGVLNQTNEQNYRTFTIDALESDPAFRAWASEFIAYLGIARLSIATEDQQFDPGSFGSSLTPSPYLDSIRALFGESRTRKVVVSWHHQYDENGLLVDEVPFNFEKDESAGSRRLFYLLGPIYDTLQKGKLLVIDEIESQMHALLLERVVELFHSRNKNKAQFIFASHGTELLSRGGLRRDQIWFVEKNQLGASSIYSLADFGSAEVRNTTAFEKNYLAGKYGAIPHFRD